MMVNNHLSSQIIEHKQEKPRHMMFEIQSLACVRQKNVVVANYPLPIETLPLQVDIGEWIHVSAVIRVAP